MIVPLAARSRPRPPPFVGPDPGLDYEYRETETKIESAHVLHLSTHLRCIPLRPAPPGHSHDPATTTTNDEHDLNICSVSLPNLHAKLVCILSCPWHPIQATIRICCELGGGRWFLSVLACLNLRRWSQNRRLRQSRLEPAVSASRLDAVSVPLLLGTDARPAARAVAEIMYILLCLLLLIRYFRS